MKENKNCKMKRKKNIYFRLSKIKQFFLQNIKLNKRLNCNLIEETATNNINKIINNKKLPLYQLFDLLFNMKIKKEIIKEQYCYMRSLYSYLEKMLNKYRVLIKQDDIPIIPLDEKNEYIINNSKSIINNNGNLEREKSFHLDSNNNSLITNLNEKINRDIKNDCKYNLICYCFEKYLKNMEINNLNLLKEAIGEKSYKNYEKFINDESIEEVSIYNTENYSLVLQRNKEIKKLRLKKKIFISD